MPDWIYEPSTGFARPRGMKLSPPRFRSFSAASHGSAHVQLSAEKVSSTPAIEAYSGQKRANYACFAWFISLLPALSRSRPAACASPFPPPQRAHLTTLMWACFWSGNRASPPSLCVPSPGHALVMANVRALHPEDHVLGNVGGVVCHTLQAAANHQRIQGLRSSVALLFHHLG